SHANLATLMEGESERAVWLCLQALRSDPGDPHLAGWLLDVQARSPRKDIAEVLRERPIASRVLAELEIAVKTAPADARVWRRLATFFGLQPGGREQQIQFDDRAVALELAAQDVLTVGPVGDIEPKVDAAFHRNLTMIVVPRGNQSRLEQRALVPRAITREIVRFVSDFDEAVRLAFGEPPFN